MEEHHAPLTVACFSVWPPTAGPVTSLKLAVALYIVASNRCRELPTFRVPRGLASRAASVANSNLTGKTFRVPFDDHGSSFTFLVPEVEKILTEDPLFAVDGEYVRLDAALLASVAWRLHLQEVEEVAVLRWPPQEMSRLLLKAVHYRAHPMLKSLFPVMSSASHMALCASDHQVLRFLRELSGKVVASSSSFITALKILDDLAAREDTSKQQQREQKAMAPPQPPPKEDDVVVVPPMPGPDVRLPSGGMGYSWNALLLVIDHMKARAAQRKLARK